MVFLSRQRKHVGDDKLDGYCGELGRNLALGTGSLETGKNNFLKNDFR